MDLNHRPHAYQACALNHLSYRPFNVKLIKKTQSKIKSFKTKQNNG